MKRILAILGVLALLGTLFVFAAPTASAGDPPPEQLQIMNRGDDDIHITSISGCNWNGSPKLPATVGAGKSVWAQFDKPGSGCEATVVAADADLKCTMLASRSDEPGANTPTVDSNTVVKIYGIGFGTAYFMTSDNCVKDNDLDIVKVITTIDPDTGYRTPLAQAALTEFDFTVKAWAESFAGGADTTSDCAGSNTSLTVGGEGFGFNFGFFADGGLVDVLNGYVDTEENEIVPCYFRVAEDELPAGWKFTFFNAFNGASPGEPGFVECVLDTDDDQRAQLTEPQLQDPIEDGACGVAFQNAALPVPIIVTKTFVGRTEYTTLDRADFHVFTPGNCSGIPIDPFGNLLGSTGLFRTVNASQDTQFVIAPPGTSDALPYAFAQTAGPSVPEGASPADEPVKCTTRVQETHAPDGCTPLGATGSNADGPYWEQTWDVGMESMVFPIVNDCAEVIPEPSVAPTSVPKKGAAAKPGAKKPSGGGTAAPKFTG
jgi:hypothetical protein